MGEFIALTEIQLPPQPLRCPRATLELRTGSPDSEALTWAASSPGCLRQLLKPNSSDTVIKIYTDTELRKPVFDFL